MPRHALSCWVIFLAFSSVRAEERSPLEWLSGDAYLETSALKDPIRLTDGIDAQKIRLDDGDKDGKVWVRIEAKRHKFNLFGDNVDTKTTRHDIVTRLKQIDVNDPMNKGRRVYALESDKLQGRLLVVVPAKQTDPYLLLVRDKDGNVETVLPLTRYSIPVPVQPCHPGCFPAGTKVLTPDGPKLIEKMRVGDVVFNVTPSGKLEPVKIASIFVGQSLLAEIETEHGKLITTGKQPLVLKNGEIKSALELVVGDELARLQEEKIRATKVRGVKLLDKQAQIFNLVLEVRGTFIADGYLVRSKPPAK